MPLYDTSIVNSLEGPLNIKGKPMKYIQYENLCTVFGIETQRFHKKEPSNIRPLENELVRKYAFKVEHLMTIMQEQLADKSTEEKKMIMTEIRKRIEERKKIEALDKSREKSNEKNSTKSNYTVTVVVKTEMSKKIIQVSIFFISFIKLY